MDIGVKRFFELEMESDLRDWLHSMNTVGLFVNQGFT
jgi:hypothetical protein